MDKINSSEAQRRARLMRSRDERLPDIRKQFEQAQKRHFNANFAPGGKDENLIRRGRAGQKNSPKNRRPNRSNRKNVPKNVNTSLSDQKTRAAVVLPVSTRKGEMVHHQRMVKEDVNAQATQHIIGLPVNKSRYNGFKGEQITLEQIKKSRLDPNSVHIIPLGGLGEMGIGKNMTAIEYKGDIVLVDMGTLFADSDYPGVNYMLADSSWLSANRHKVRAIVFTHAHLDHIGACKHLLPEFGPLVPIYATAFTIGMIKKQMSELADTPDLNYHEVDPLKHEIIPLSEFISVELVHTLHSIPGNVSLIFRTPCGNILLSGDWRFEKNPMDTPADYDRLLEVRDKEGYALLINESTNIDVPGRHPHSEYDVGENIGRVMDHYANGRVIVSCFSSQVKRIELILNEAAKRGRKVAFAGFSMINNVEVALRAHAIKIPKNTVMKMEDIIKLPDEKVTIVCTGSQGELNAVLNRMVSGSHRFIKIKASDTIVFSSNPIPGNEPRVVSTVGGLMREGAQVIQNGKTHLTNIGPLHLSGHAFYEDHVQFVTDMKPENYLPYHGEFFMLEHNAEMAENVAGIPRDRILVVDDGDIVELTPEHRIRRNGRVPVGNRLYDDTDHEVNEAVVKDRIHISREGIFIVVLTVSKKTGRLIKTPDIVSRAFIFLDHSEDLIGKVRHYLREKSDRLASLHADDMQQIKDDIRDDVTHILFDATGHTPIVIPVINKV